MKKNFKKALKHVLVHEGGWADHPRDPGGATMKGVTLATYRSHFGEGKSKNDLWNITDEELGQVYRSGYWSKCHCDELPAGVDYVAFGAAVNSGPGAAQSGYKLRLEPSRMEVWGLKHFPESKNKTPSKALTPSATVVWLSCVTFLHGLHLERGGKAVWRACAPQRSLWLEETAQP